jgi:nucleotide-binding universal stress UspA family protein
VREEGPKALLLNEAEGWNADSIFAGARGLGRVERLLTGSVSSSVAARANCSGEIVRVA